MRTLGHIAALLLAALEVACQHSEGRYLRRSVARTELIGVWVGTPFAMESLRFAGVTTRLTGTDRRLLVNADGTCEADTILAPVVQPETWVSPAMSCHWRLGSNGGHQTFEASLDTASGHEKRLSYYFDEEAGSIVLWQYVDDPDQWKYMEFRKASAGWDDNGG